MDSQRRQANQLKAEKFVHREESLPQPVVEKLEFIEVEKTNLRKELNECKALLQAAQPIEPRETMKNSATPATVLEAKCRAVPEQAAEEPLTMASIMAHLTALLE